MHKKVFNAAADETPLTMAVLRDHLQGRSEVNIYIYMYVCTHMYIHVYVNRDI